MNTTIALDRLFHAPRDRVYRAFTTADILDRFWGPDGFTTKTSHLDVRPGGEWRYVMAHPEYGTYQNRVRYQVVVPNERLEYLHDDGTDDYPTMSVSLTFAEEDGRTRVRLENRLPTVEAYEEALGFHAVEAGNQTLASMASFTDLEVSLPSGEPNAELVREFAASADDVFAAFVTPALLRRWWGPHEMTTCEIDARVGGLWRFVCRTPEGNEHVFSGEILAMEPGRHLRWTSSYLSESCIEEFIFEEHGGFTRVRNRVEHVSPEARDAMVTDGMIWGARVSMRRLADLLASAAQV